MELDDIIYVSLLIFTIVFGHFVRRISNIETKKCASSVVGLLIVFLVSGKHIFHPVVCTLVNSLIIVYSSKRLCHIYSFIFSFLYLIFFRSTLYFGIPYPPGHTNMVQMMMTLKLVGLAFEVHDSWVNLKEKDKSKEKSKEDIKVFDDINPTLKDIFQFSFCYIGVLTGPYYSFKTFKDYFQTEYFKYAECGKMTLKKLTFVPVFAILFLISTHYFPIQYAESDEFYSDRSFWYRLWYIVPVFFSFRMRIYVGLVLSEAACTMAGLGAYPVSTNPKPGKGPSENLEVLSKINANQQMLQSTQYNFETVHNVYPWYTEFDPSVRSSIRYWNTCVQYWMAYVVYKRFPYKALRTAATFGVSALWHGIYAGYYLCLLSVPFYLIVEDVWESLFRQKATGITRKILDVVYWFVRTQAFSYMGMAFSLLTMENGLRYFGSIYYCYHFTSLFGLILGLALKKILRKKKTSTETEKVELKKQK